MFKLILLSVVAVPVLLGMQEARIRDRRQAVAVLAVLLLAYDAFYVLVLLYLRMRWIG
jgi:hypothetical protein